MSVTPNLGLELVPSNSLQPSVSINDAFQLIDTLLQLVVVSSTVTTPPATVAGDVGKRWVVPSGATGAWSGKTNAIALCTGVNLWRFITPANGWRADRLTDSKVIRFNGTTWVAL